MTSATPTRAALIALDWGTSSLRAYRLDGGGRTLDARHLPWGIMRLPQPLQDGAATPTLSGFELAFEQACGDWLRAEPALPVIACGMVGSAQGWQEAAYLDVPVALDRIGTLLTVVERPGATPVHIVPGLIQRHGLPNVMRGEETQVFGVLRDARAVPDAGLLIGLPGTHSKWVGARNGQVTHFDTFMTGEVYAALRGHTILGRTMSDAAAPDMAAFERGLKVAGAPEGRAGVLSTIFSTRAGPDRRTGAGLAGRLPVGPADRPRDRRPGRHAARAGPGAPHRPLRRTGAVRALHAGHDPLRPGRARAGAERHRARPVAPGAGRRAGPLIFDFRLGAHP